MRAVINLAGIGLIVLGLMAVVYLTMAFSLPDRKTAMKFGPIEAPQIHIPALERPSDEVSLVLEKR